MKFWRKLLSFWWWLKNSVFLSRPFWSFFSYFFFFFCFKFIQIIHSLWDTKDGTKFWWLPLFAAKNNSCQLIWTSLYVIGLLILTHIYQQVSGPLLNRKFSVSIPWTFLWIWIWSMRYNITCTCNLLPIRIVLRYCTCNPIMLKKL